MKTVVVAEPAFLPLVRGRFVDYLELTKPKIAVLVLFTVAAGFLLASPGAIHFVALVHTVLGTALVAAGASVLNQCLERRTDALMRRTENRPLPGGRLPSAEAYVFGLLLAASGLTYLGLLVQRPSAVIVAAVTFVSYVWVYTPLKRVTTLNTLVGAVPGALPPVIGWTAACGEITFEAGVLFLILFLWQVPHFLAIAWIYRDDYARAGMKMLPVVDGPGHVTGRQMLLYCLCLVAVSVLPVATGPAGLLYAAGAALVGTPFLLATLGFVRAPSTAAARRVLRGSLIYLPVILALLLICLHGRAG